MANLFLRREGALARAPTLLEALLVWLIFFVDREGVLVRAPALLEAAFVRLVFLCFTSF